MGEASGEKVTMPVFTLRDFVRAGMQRLQLEVLTGETGLDREVIEPMAHRPGLALTGFYEHFAWQRPQVVGQAERAYLDSLGVEGARNRLRELFARGAYCLVFACGMDVPQSVIEIAQEAGAAVFRTRLLTREFFHQAAFVLESLRAPRAKVYGTTVEVAGLGVMMEGAPGLGKSETALGLIKHGNALVADDLTCLRRDVAEDVLFAYASEATRDYMEIRGIGIIHVPSIFGVTAVRGEKQLDLVITFRQMQEVDGELDRAGEDRFTKTILGVEVPQIVIPVSAGRDLVNLVETAAQQFKLRASGRDATADLDHRLKERANAARIQKEGQ